MNKDVGGEQLWEALTGRLAYICQEDVRAEQGGEHLLGLLQLHLL